MATKKAAKKAAPKKKTASSNRSKPRKTGAKNLQTAEAKTENVNDPSKKLKTLEEIGVPKERIGENLHEQNPDLHMAINANKARKQQEQPETLTGSRAEEFIRKNPSGAPTRR